MVSVLDSSNSQDIGSVERALRRYWDAAILPTAVAAEVAMLGNSVHLHVASL